MNEIITRSLEGNDTTWLAQFPPELMSDDEQEVVNFVLTYASEYGKAPSVRRVMEKFDLFLPYKFETSSWEPEEPPIGDVFDQSIQRKLLTETSRMLREVDEVMRRDKEVPLDILAEIEKVHALSLGVLRYSSFDRSLYFRRRAMNLPFKVINRHIGGISNGDFMLIIGRLGSGKSTIAQFIAKHVWEEGKRVLFISAEMLGLDVFSRIDAMVGKFNPLDLRTTDDDVSAKLDDILATVYKKAKGAKGEIIVPRSRLLSPAQIASFAKNLAVDMIIVDGAYLLQPSSGHYTSRWERVATVSNELKQAALDLDLPLVATAQIKRGADGKDGYDPEDISYSDALGQDSDFVVAVYPNKVIEERAELQLIKNRYGSNCATQIYTDFKTMTIVDESIEGAVKGRSGVELVEDW